MAAHPEAGEGLHIVFSVRVTRQLGHCTSTLYHIGRLRSRE